MHLQDGLQAWIIQVGEYDERKQRLWDAGTVFEGSSHDLMSEHVGSGRAMRFRVASAPCC